MEKRYWTNVLWSPSYFAASCGGAPLGRYIEQQKPPIYNGPYISGLKVRGFTARVVNKRLSVEGALLVHACNLVKICGKHFLRVIPGVVDLPRDPCERLDSSQVRSQKALFGRAPEKSKTQNQDNNHGSRSDDCGPPVPIHWRSSAGAAFAEALQGSTRKFRR